jgi:hypothetical protein
MGDKPTWFKHLGAWASNPTTILLVIILGMLLHITIQQNLEDTTKSKYSKEFTTVESFLANQPKISPPIVTAQSALTYALSLGRIKSAIDPYEKEFTNWRATAISYDVLPVEERGGKIPVPPPFQITIEATENKVPKPRTTFSLHQNGEVYGKIDFISEK